MRKTEGEAEAWRRVKERTRQGKEGMVHERVLTGDDSGAFQPNVGKADRGKLGANMRNEAPRGLPNSEKRQCGKEKGGRVGVHLLFQFRWSAKSLNLPAKLFFA